MNRRPALLRPHSLPGSTLRIVFDYVLVVLGSALIAAALDVFLLPNQVVAGGVTGLAAIAHLALGLPFGLVLIGLNVPLCVLQWRFLGGLNALARTITGVISVALFADLMTTWLPPVTDDRLLIITFGGGLSGLGLALVFHGRGTTGGADILARVLHRAWGWRFGQTLLGVNILVYGLAAVLFGPEPAMIALLVSFVMSRALDSILHGLSSSRAVLVVSAQPDRVREAVTRTMGRGLTILPAEGGYSGRQTSILYVVVPRADIQRLKLRIFDQDPGAFLTILTPQEAVGGFQPPARM